MNILRLLQELRIFWSEQYLRSILNNLQRVGLNMIYKKHDIMSIVKVMDLQNIPKDTDRFGRPQSNRYDFIKYYIPCISLCLKDCIFNISNHKDSKQQNFHHQNNHPLGGRINQFYSNRCDYLRKINSQQMRGHHKLNN